MATDCQAEQLAPTPEAKGDRTYSNVCIERESGDYGGLEVVVRGSSQQPRVLSSYAEGSLPQLTEAPSRLVNGRLTFMIVGDIPEESFSGEVRRDYLIVHSRVPGSKAFRLPFRRDPKKNPTCR